MAIKKVPMRTCLGCRESKPKRELIRVVRTPEGAVEIDPKGKKSGRGAYICPDMECLDKAVGRKQLERSLECSIPKELKDELHRYLNE